MNRSTRIVVGAAIAVLAVSAILGRVLEGRFAAGSLLPPDAGALVPPVGIAGAVALAGFAFVYRRRLRLRAVTALAGCGWAPARISRRTHLSQDAVRTLLRAERRIRSARPARGGRPFRVESAAPASSAAGGELLKAAMSWGRRR